MLQFQICLCKIITDGWAAYKSLGDHRYEFDFVNHSENFVKPGCPDVHTNTIEGVVFQFIYGITYIK